jgi:ABC-type phosphate transport system substrate-binding protein
MSGRYGPGRHRRRRPRGVHIAARVAFAGTLLVVLAAGPWFGPHAVADARATAKAVTINPADDLGDNEFVRVSWSGFGAFVFFRQCTQHPTAASTDCTPLYSFPGYSDGSGAGVAYEQIHLGDVPNGAGSTFRCDLDTPCSLGVFSDATLGSGAFADLSFAPTADSCPDPDETVAISGSGADQPNAALYRWSTKVCQPPASLPVGYLPLNSIDGRENFVNQLSDFAVTMTPFSSAEDAQLTTNRQTYDYAPVTASALVLAFKAFDQSSGTQGAQILSLKLTPALLAQIFTGRITNWNTVSEIKSLNPGIVFPRSIMPLVRGDHSAANLFFTGWLGATARSSLPHDWPGASVDYPIQYLVQANGVVGGDRLAHAMADPTILGDQLNPDFSQAGYIGFMDASEAAYYGLPTVQIQNKSGHFVGPTSDAILAGLAGAHKVADGRMLQPNYSDTNPAAYPLPLVSYVAAPTDLIDPAKGATLVGFLKYAVGDGQSGTNLPPGYVPLPDNLVQQALHVADEIPDAPGEGSPPPPSPTPSPTPSSSPSPYPTDSPFPIPTDSGYSPIPIPSGGDTSGLGGTTCTAPTATPTPTTTASLGPTPSASASASPSASPSPSPSASQDPNQSAVVAAAASPSPTPSATGTPTPSPSSSGSTPSPGTSPTPSPSASEEAPAAGDGGTTPCTAGSVSSLPSSSLGETAARYLLPSLAGLGLLGVVGGVAMEAAGRRGGAGLLSSTGRALQRLPLPRWLRP